MLTNLRVKNFKAWKDSRDIRLAPLTVLFGTNSAGKSSIPQLLLLLKQTAESSDRLATLQLGDNRTLVDAGTYDDIVHNHDTTQPVEIDLQWTLDDNLAITNPLGGANYTGDTIRFRVTLKGDRRHQPLVQSLEYSLTNREGTVLDVGMESRESESKFDLVSGQYEFVRHPGRAWPLPRPVRFYGFPD